ncbi:MAG: 6-pyruvoyl trahydropterin synthase family protein [Bacteroidota bacterium]
MKITVGRVAHFNAAHRLYRSDWDEARNREVFGKCSLTNYHGHNYEMKVEVTGSVDPETGYVIDLKVLSDLIEQKVTDRLDHRNLNLDIPEFANLNPTAEHISALIWNILRGELPDHLDLKVILYETPRNYAVCTGP